MKRTSNPCAATCTDGSKCGKRAPLGEQFCSAHRGTTVGKPFEPKLTDIATELQRLMRSSDDNVKLRAIEAWQKYEDRRSAKGTTDNGYQDLVRLLTDDEKAALGEALDRIAAIKEAVYARNPDLTPDAMTLGRRLREQASEHVSFEPLGEESAPRQAVSPAVEGAPAPPADLNKEPKPSAEQPVVDLPFEPLDGQLTADDVRRVYGATHVEETAPGQFRWIEESEPQS